MYPRLLTTIFHTLSLLLLDCQRALRSSPNDDLVVNDDDDGILSNGDSSGDGEGVRCDETREPPSTSPTSNEKKGSRVSAQCAQSIEKIVLQVLGGTRPNDVRLEHVIDVNTCLAVG